MHLTQPATKLALLAAITLTAITTPAAAQDLLWTRQLGIQSWDIGSDVAVDGAGNAYITGSTWGNLGGLNAGEDDAFVAKYDAAGTLLWTRQAGTTGQDIGFGVAVDGAGNAYIAGITEGNLGGPSAGSGDYFLAKYDTTGTLLWMRQAGTSTLDSGQGVAVDSAGNAYITGITNGSLGGANAGIWDAFLAKYDTSGTLLWTRQIGTSGLDEGTGVAVDDVGNAYITGQTSGSLGGQGAGGYEVFLAKYDASGTLLWTRQTGTAADEEDPGIAVDNAGNAYITGQTSGSLGGPNAGGTDAFVVKYDASGTLLWTRQTGTSRWDEGFSVDVDSAGNAYITGQTLGSFGGPSAGDWDALLIKYDASGTLLWTRQTGTSSFDEGSGVAVDSAGNAYITGRTGGSLGGPNAGASDIFLAKFGETPCYADCDKSTGNGVLDVFDFLCFQNSFVNSEPDACDCDTSTGLGVCDIFDFLCFQNAFVAGCP